MRPLLCKAQNGALANTSKLFSPVYDIMFHSFYVYHLNKCRHSNQIQPQPPSVQVLLVCEVCFVPASSEQIKAFSAMTAPKQTYFVGWVMKGVPSLLWRVVWDSTARPVPELSVILGKSRVWVHSLIARVFTQGILNIMKLVHLFEAMVMGLLRPVLSTQT